MKYTLTQFLEKFEKAVKNGTPKLDRGRIQVLGIDTTSSGHPFCPLSVAFPDVRWTALHDKGYLTYDDVWTVVAAADNHTLHNPEVALLRKQLLKIAGLAVLLLLLVSPAKAWNCSDPLASRVPVPAGTSGSYGNGDGQLFLGTSSEGVKGQLYQCQVPKPPTQSPSTSTQSQTQNQTQNQSNSQNSTTTSNASSTAAGGSSTATGGSSVLKNSGNSTLKNSGNSSNENKNTANGGAGGQGGTGVGGNQSQESNSSASNNGNGANNASYESNTTVEASKIPVSTAIGVAPPSNLNCAIGYGGGVQTAGLGISGAFSRVDKNCARLTVALTARNRLSYCKVYITNKYAKEAGVTLADCLQEEKVVVPVPVAVTPTPAPQPVELHVTVDQPAPVVPIIKTQTEQSVLIGSCRYDLQNECKRILNDAIIGLQPGQRIRTVGPREAGYLAAYLNERHVSRSLLDHRYSDDQNGTVNIYVLFPIESN